MTDTMNTPGPNKRIFAFLVDQLVILVLVAVCPSHNFLAFLFVTLYWLLRDIRGKSPGKLLSGLKVVDRNGQEADIPKKILRNLTITLPFFFIVEYFFMRTSAEGLRLGDRMVGTRVIDLNPSWKDRNFLLLTIPILVLEYVIVKMFVMPLYIK